MEREKISAQTINELSDFSEFSGELPDLNDVEKPALRRAIDRVVASKRPGAPQQHQKHSSHDRSK